MPWSGIIYQPSTPPFKVAFTPINGEEGAWVLVPLSCASNRPSGADRICQQCVKARERSDRAGTHPIGRIFENLCMKMALSCTQNAITGFFVCLFSFFLSSLFSFFFFSLFFFSPLLFFSLQNHRGANCPPAPPPPCGAATGLHTALKNISTKLSIHRDQWMSITALCISSLSCNVVAFFLTVYRFKLWATLWHF